MLLTIGRSVSCMKTIKYRYTYSSRMVTELDNRYAGVYSRLHARQKKSALISTSLVQVWSARRKQEAIGDTRALSGWDAVPLLHMYIDANKTGGTRRVNSSGMCFLCGRGWTRAPNISMSGHAHRTNWLGGLHFTSQHDTQQTFCQTHSLSTCSFNYDRNTFSMHLLHIINKKKFDIPNQNCVALVWSHGDDTQMNNILNHITLTSTFSFKWKKYFLQLVPYPEFTV